MAVGGAERRRQLLVGAADLGRRLGVVAHAVGEVGDLADRLGDRLALLGGEHRARAPWRAPRSARRPWRGSCARFSTSVAAQSRTRAWRWRRPARRRAASRSGRSPTASSVAGLTTSSSSLRAARRHSLRSTSMLASGLLCLGSRPSALRRRHATLSSGSVRAAAGSRRRRSAASARRARQLLLLARRDAGGEHARRRSRAARRARRRRRASRPRRRARAGRTIAPIPISAPSSITQPSSSAPWPIDDARRPIIVGSSMRAVRSPRCPGSRPPAPISMCEQSPRRTAPNQMLARSPTRTSPISTAVGASHTSRADRGRDAVELDERRHSAATRGALISPRQHRADELDLIERILYGVAVSQVSHVENLES